MTLGDPASAASQSAASQLSNRWVRIEPASEGPVALGIGNEANSGGAAAEEMTGFRPKAGVTSPEYAYDIQQHEVTWGELDPWLVNNPDHNNPDQQFTLPTHVPAAPAAREQLPATGIPPLGAEAYCKMLCGEGVCVDQFVDARAHVGFRCVRSAP